MEKRVWRLIPHHEKRDLALEWIRTNKRIAIGWGQIGDLNSLQPQSAADISAAIARRYPAERNATNGGRSLWNLYREMQKGDLVILSGSKKSRELVVEIAGDYEFSSDSPGIRGDRLTGDYFYQRPVLLTDLNPDELWHKAGGAVQGQSIYQTLIPCANAPLERRATNGSGDKLMGILAHLTSVTKHTRNILLYGPPGTGKTYHVRKFADTFLHEQLQSPMSDPQSRLKVLEGLTWWQAVALAMAVGGREQWKARELAESELIRAFAPLKNNTNINAKIQQVLQMHTGEQSDTVHYRLELRSSPSLFDKTGRTVDAQWHLTEEGKQYVEENLRDELDLLRHRQQAPQNLSDFLEFVTFHQSFAYEEFVEGLKPENDDEGQVRYDVQDGVFKRICRRAQADPSNKYLLIIDEINRANIAKVLGELITLIEDDKRSGEANEVVITLPYSKQKFGVPPNLTILGTMNTADRSIALLDLALRRRFTFVEMMPEPSLLPTVADINLATLLTNLNQRVAALLDRDHQIGHSYLMNANDAEGLHFAWYHRVVPLLQEYFYNDGERLRAVLGDDFVTRQQVDTATQNALGDLYDGDTPRYEIVKIEGPELLSALRRLAGA